MPDPKLISRDSARGWQRTHRAPEIAASLVRASARRSQISRKENCVERPTPRLGFSVRDNPPRTSSNMMARGRGLEDWRSGPAGILGGGGEGDGVLRELPRGVEVPPAGFPAAGAVAAGRQQGRGT